MSRTLNLTDTRPDLIASTIRDIYAGGSSFANKLPARDMEPTVSAAWRAADKLSLAERAELEPHLSALIETKEKLERAIALASGEELT